MKRFLIILPFLLIATTAKAQIGFDGSSNHAGGTNSSYSWSHTVTSTRNTILCVGVSIVDTNSAAIVSTITWNTSQSLSKIVSQPSGSSWNPNNNRSEIWCVLNPGTGTHNIAVTLGAGPAQASIAGAVSLSGVNQSLTVDGTGSSFSANGGGTTEPTGTVVTNFLNDWVIDTLTNNSNQAVAATSPSIQRWSTASSTFSGSGSTYPVGAAGTYTMNWTGSTQAWSQSIIALKWDGSALPAVTYFISPTGNDSNAGTSSGSPWLTPNHSVNCGDLISAAAGTYTASNFTSTWGQVTCQAGNNVAWLQCATFDACKISSGVANQGMYVNAPYWGVQGWEVTSTIDGAFCFEAYPASLTVSTHHVIFANNVANSCFLAGFGSGGTVSSGVDYYVIVGNIIYNAAQDVGGCVSGIDIFNPENIDTLPGTHYYIAGNFSYANLNPNPCGGGVPSDGEGILLDDLDGSQVGSAAYTGQIVIDNNILLANGGRGFQAYLNAGSSYAHIYVRHNTAWGNNFQTSDPNNLCGEFLLNFSKGTEEFFNLGATNASVGCSGGTNPLYGFSVGNGDGSNHVYNNTAWSAAGNFTQSVGNTGFSFGPNNVTSTTLAFTNATTPGAPSCGSASSVPNCMATVIANFTPTTAASKAYGYQTPKTTSIYDPLYPQWLCTVTNLPTGLVTPGCLAGSYYGPGVTVH